MSELSRRTFLGTSLAAAATLPTLRAAAADKLVVGVMGTGGRGTGLAKAFASQANVTVAAVCDADQKRAGNAADELVKAGKAKPEVYTDFRKILDDKSIDILVCAAPNHWHAIAGILACSAGKHAYIEKPCSHTPREGELLVEAARKNKRMVQMGNQRRSFPKIQEAIQKLHEGAIGRVYFAQGWYANSRPGIGKGEAKDPPAELNYDLWQGPTVHRPFKSNYLHYNWHWFWNWGNGELGNNGIHYLDILRWGLGVDFPTQVTSSGGRYRYQDDQETPDTHVVGFDFPDRKSCVWEGYSCNRIPGDKNPDMLFQGETGSLTINGSNYTIFDNKGKVVSEVKGTGGDAVHIGNFLDSCRGTAKLNSEIGEGAKSTLLCHLGNIAHRVGRTLHCDAKDGKIINDADAMKLWTKEYEKGWEPKV